MYGGDEVNALVLEVGSHSTKVGYAGQDIPEYIFPSLVGEISEEGYKSKLEDGMLTQQNQDFYQDKPVQKRHYIGGNRINYKRDYMDLIPVIQQDYKYDWGLLEEVMHYALVDQLNSVPSEAPLMLSEFCTASTTEREKLLELAFESLNVPAMFPARNSILHSFAMGRQSSLVVDIGHNGSTVSAVYDGCYLKQPTQQTYVGGDCLCQCLKASLENKQQGQIVPNYQLSKLFIGDNQQIQKLETPNISQSYHKFQVDKIVSDIMENLCWVNDTKFIEEDNAFLPSSVYELPDGKEVQIGTERFKIPEILFSPELIQTYPGLVLDESKQPPAQPMSLQEMVVQSINRCDIDIRKDLYNGIIVVGGLSQFSQIKERLEMEVGNVGPYGIKVRTSAPQNSIEKKCTSWIGGSILSILGTFQQMWISKQQYQEYGSQIVHKASP